MTPTIYQQRRAALMEQCAEESLVFLFSGSGIMRSEDEAWPFSVNRNFYYLTGLDREDMVLQLQKHAGQVISTLYIQPFDEVQARWVGGRMRKEEAQKKAQVDRVFEVTELEEAVASLYNRLRSAANLKVYVDGWHYRWNQSDSSAMQFVRQLKERYPLWSVCDLYPLLTGLRMIKDETEIEAIRKANEITRDGVIAMMKTIQDGKREMELEGTFLLELMKKGCKTTAFPTIAASGKNAAVLHYSSNTDFCRDGELFLCDLGATYDYYCADISRTFPVNGTFTKRQRMIYECVLQAQQLVEKNCRPGITLRQLNQQVVQFYQSKLEELQLSGPVQEYYFHSVSHHLGLDTHDVNLENAVLKPGMVITNEPGLYIEEEGMGIRIEDDLLVTESGCENLSCTPKTIEEIESIMRK